MPTLTFQLNSTFSSPYFGEAANLSTGEVGVLYIEHNDRLDELKKQEATWVVSCFYGGENSPFEEGNRDFRVRVTPYSDGIIKVERLDKPIENQLPNRATYFYSPSERLLDEFQEGIEKYVHLRKDEMTIDELTEILCQSLPQRYGPLLGYVKAEITYVLSDM